MPESQERPQKQEHQAVARWVLHFSAPRPVLHPLHETAAFRWAATALGSKARPRRGEVNKRRYQDALVLVGPKNKALLMNNIWFSMCQA